MESVLFQNRLQYYESIEAARKANDSGPFIEFMLLALLNTLKAQAERSKSDGIKVGLNDGIKINNKDGLGESQKKILKLIESNPYITATTLATKIEITKRNIEKNIKVLKDLGLLTRVGARQNRYWEVKQ